MRPSYDVKVYDIRERKDRTGTKKKTGTSKLYRLRWTVGPKRFERSYTTKALGDSFRADLVKAARSGEPFDLDEGLPASMMREQNRTTWYQHVRAYMDERWPSLAPKSRNSSVDALATVTSALLPDSSGRPGVELLRRALVWAFNPNTSRIEASREVAQALAWVERVSPVVTRLAESEVIRSALNACARKMDGTPAAATTTARKRAVLYNVLGYAVELGILDSNPIDRVQWKAPATADTVDRRVVASTAQVEAILKHVPAVDHRSAHYVAFFACLYYAGMRPSEAASLRQGDLELPTRGWGRANLVETAPRTSVHWTDSGETHERRGLKHRGRREVRSVPIPPVLVDILRSHLASYPLSADGRLFYAARGGYLSDTDYRRIWKSARSQALTPDQAASPLAARPYDLRHAAVSLWLNGGVPASEVARRAGHGVAVLLRVYAGCIDGEENTMNARIEKALQAGRTRGRIGGSVGRQRGVDRKKRRSMA